MYADEKWYDTPPGLFLILIIGTILFLMLIAGGFTIYEMQTTRLETFTITEKIFRTEVIPNGKSNRKADIFYIISNDAIVKIGETPKAEILRALEIGRTVCLEVWGDAEVPKLRKILYEGPCRNRRVG